MPSMFVLLFCAFSLLVPGLSVNCAQPCFAAPRVQEEAQAVQNTLLLSNKSHHDLVAIRLSDGTTTSFARMDLGPGSEDELENPGGTQDVRLDMGFALWNFRAVRLDRLAGFAACGTHEPACLILVHRNGREEHRRGEVWNLLPEPGSRPVCALTRFHAGMKMRDACDIIEKDAPRDENGAVLTSLGFADLIWAARLTPGTGDPATALLEHLELRQVLQREHLRALLRTLSAQGYGLWQAEFPGMTFDFTEMAAIDEDKRHAILEQGVDLLFAAGTGEATIMAAPKTQIPLLREADAPEQDVQLFTISLQPASRTLLVDIAAYRAERAGEETPAAPGRKGGATEAAGR